LGSNLGQLNTTLMGLIKEFREFALKGNVVELAIAVIIGAAFGAIVTSLVDDIVTPLLLQPALEAANVKDLAQLSWNGVKYGKFLSAVITFILIALVLFFLIKGINHLKERKKEAPKEPELSMTEKLLMEIRDNLRR
jgi:large conductance mechanosensitive channel